MAASPWSLPESWVEGHGPQVVTDHQPEQPLGARLNLLPHHQQLQPPFRDCLSPVDRAGQLAVDRGAGGGAVAEVDSGERALFPA